MSKNIANTNCLHDMQCPQCKSTEPFAIGVTTTFRVFDEGTEEQLGDIQWNDDSYCKCGLCAFSGKVRDFTLAHGVAA